MVGEEDLETNDDPQIRGDSIVEAANKVLDFEAFKKDQEKALRDFKKE